MNNNPVRARCVYALLISAVILLGLASRAKPLQPDLPHFIGEYAGDTLWALMIFLGFGLLFPTLSSWRIAALALLFSVSIELSQLYHAPWIDAIRHTRVGGLILGFGFLWSDLVCYLIGVLGGIALESMVSLAKVRRSG